MDFFLLVEEQRDGLIGAGGGGEARVGGCHRFAGWSRHFARKVLNTRLQLLLLLSTTTT